MFNMVFAFALANTAFCGWMVSQGSYGLAAMNALAAIYGFMVVSK
jgi:hypothetical protein